MDREARPAAERVEGSYPGRAMQLPGATMDRVLDGWPVARLATVAHNGAPHIVPIVFARVQGRIWSPVDGKPKAGGQLARIENIRSRPEVSLLLDDYLDDWTELWWLRVDGRASVRTPADPEKDREVAPALAALRRKYPQYESVALLGQPPTLIVIEVAALRSWCVSADVLPRLSGS